MIMEYVRRLRGHIPGRSDAWVAARRLEYVAGRNPPPDVLEVDAFSASTIVLALARIVDIHPYPLDELMLMVAAFAYHRPEAVIDIGTHYGKSARIWHELATLFELHTAVHTIDLLDPKHPEFPGDQHAKYIRDKNVQIHQGDGSTIAAELIAENPYRRYLLFLDGDHRQESVLKELALVRTMQRGGVLLHDTFFQPSSRYNHGPYLALQEFLETFAAKQVIHVQTGLPGMSYIGLPLR